MISSPSGIVMMGGGTIEDFSSDRISISVKAAIVRNGQVLLVEYLDDWGPHFNLPGGRVKLGEPLEEAVRRKVEEEIQTVITVGRLLLVVEYVPSRWANMFGTLHKLQFNFAASLKDGQVPVSATYDPHQIGITWVPIEGLESIVLLPRVAARLKEALGVRDTMNAYCPTV